MNKLIKVSSFILLFIVSVSFSSQSFARNYSFSNDQVTDGDMLAEWLVRPAAAIGTIAGGVTFIAGLPFSVMADNTEESFDILVQEPFEYTFHRPLGHYSTNSGH